MINGRPPIPPSLYRLLNRCFQKDLLRRWDNMDAVYRELVTIYEDLIGQPYFRIKPTFEIKKLPGDLSVHKVMETEESVSYRWLERVMALKNTQDVSGAEQSKSSRSRRSNILSGIERFEYAAELYQECIVSG